MTAQLRLSRAFLPAALVAGLLAWATPASAATTIPVTTVAPSPGAAGDCTLGEAIEAANSDEAVDACPAGSGTDTISLPSGTYTLSTVDHTSPDGAVALPEIDSSLTIQGANPQNTIIRRNTAGGTPAFMLFHMDVSTENQCWPSCTLTFKGVSLQSASGMGGAITNRAGRIVFDNALLAASTSGPAVYSTGTISVRNESLITNNSSSGDGGVIKSDGNITIADSKFELNNGGAGGALYLGAAGTATVSETDFDQNTATTGGVFSGLGTWRVSKSSFTGNDALGGSGGVFGGVAGDIEISGSYFYANEAIGMEGGAIESTGDLDVASTTFQENLSDIGGAISSRGPSMSVVNSTFGGNSSGTKGGGLFASGGSVTISNSTFGENFSGYGGGFAWEQNGGSMALRNTLLATNASIVSGMDCESDSAIASQGYNLVADATGCQITPATGDQLGTTAAPIDALLAPLDSSGTYTKTFALQPGSPAIDTGNPGAPGSGGTSCEQFDQRAIVRPRDGDGDDIFRCDIGAYEGGIGLPLLTVEKTGTGTGLVEANSGTIVCGSDCVESYPQGTSVVLVATPTTDAEFTSWTGCDSVAGDQCTVSMTADRTVTVEFTDVQNVLSVTRTGSGQGAVSSSPAGINCGLDCGELYAYGEVITLTANPASNSNFHFWSGCDETSGLTCTLTLNEDRSVFASFSPIVRTLSINKLGSGVGNVASDPVGIDCGSDCGESYQIGTEVTLTAAPGPNSDFDGWSGCDSVNVLTCTVTVNNNQAVSATFLPAQQPLTVTKAGTADGTVTSSPAGINCPGTCTDNFDEGSTVTLTANPDSVAQLDSWSGCDTTVGNTCTVQMDAAESVTATFGPAQRNLTVAKSGTGNGTVASNPTGVDCGSDCSQTYDHGTSVTLTATAAEGSTFGGWTNCPGATGNVCTTSMLSDKTVTASFTVLQRTLNVSKSGTGTGIVSSAPAGIACGVDCTQDYDHGTSVVLTATADTGWEFAGWTGCDSVNGTQCTVSMNGTENVTANFGPIQRLLTVTKDGNGSGAVTSFQPGIDCGVTCSTTFDHGTWVTLEADPAAGSALASWTGCEQLSYAPLSCMVHLDQARNVTATFTTDAQPLNVSITTHMTGTGSVTSSPAGIDCGSDCTESYAPGTLVTLTPVPGPNSIFLEWEACLGNTSLEDDTCVVTMEHAQTAVAKFAPTVHGLDVTFDVHPDASGAGTLDMVTDTYTGQCDMRLFFCGESFYLGTEVTLTATTLSGDEEVTSWDGCDSVTGNECTLTVDGEENVTVHTDLVRRPVNVTKAGTGSGTVVSDPLGIDCGSDCTANVVKNQTIDLSATPGANSFFVGWTGCDSIVDGVCSVIGNTSTSEVTATFGLVSRTLTVAKDGSGTGTVASAPVGIDCGSDCTQDHEHGTSVTLTATPGANSVFSGWSGCVSGTNECTVTMDAAKTVTATFAPMQRALTVSKSGPATGSVLSSPVGIDCGSDCSDDYDHGTSVELTPTAGTNSVFSSWTGCDSVEGNVCTVTMTAAKSVTATFGLEQRALSVSRDGAGSGSVASSPVGIDCGSDCGQSYDHGTAVTLTATEGVNSDFAGWTGCTSATNECTVTMDAAKEVTATFALESRALNVSKDGAGNGSVASSPTGIDCGSDCTHDYPYGTSVTLTATPDGNSGFSSWSGCDSTSGLTCTVAMNGAESVTATFSDTQRNLTVRSHRVSNDSAAAGSVTTDVGGMNCAVPNECTESFGQGTVVVLTAAPAANNEFVEWTGCDVPAGTTCTVTLGSSKTVTATFHNSSAPSSSLPSVPTLTRTTSPSFGYTATAGAGTSLTAVELWLNGPGAGDFVKVDEAAGAGASGTFQNVALTEGDGVYELKTRARNDAGNYEDGTATQFTLDTTIPGSSISGNATENTNEFDLNWTLDDPTADIELWVDGPGAGEPTLADEISAPGAASGTFTIGITEGAGSYSFYSVAEDAAGNREATPGTPDAVVDVELCVGYEDDPRIHIVGTDGNDRLKGTGADEVICGGTGNDILKGGKGADLLLGGDGKDTATYAERTSKQRITVTVNDGNANDGQSGEGDEVGVGVENVTGGKANDVIKGDRLGNILKGGVGNDSIKGVGGKDKLYGDKGKDKLDGGKKTDTCKTGESYKACEKR